MTTFKKGQRVWWDDPICEESGEYEVLDSQDEQHTNKPESERIIRIGDGEKTWEVPADYLSIVCPISDEDREHLAIQEHRNRIRDKELIEQMRALSFSSKTKISKPKATPSASTMKTTTLAAFTDFL